jgi:flotillin
MGAAGVIVIVIGLVIAAVLIVGLIASMFRKVGPNQALIVYGFGGTRVVIGNGKVVIPMLQQARELSLELMSFDVAPTQSLYTSQGVAVNVEAVSQIKVKSDEISIKTAAEQFLNKPPQEREALIRLVMEGHLRGIVGLLTVEQIVKEPEMVAGRVRQMVADDLSKMGLEVISFTIKKVMDESDYITNMGRPDVARIKREADIAQAEAERDTAIRRAMASREAAVAQAQADQERIIAQTASETRQAEAQRDLELKRAAYEAEVRRERALAEKAYDIAANQAQQQVVTEAVKVEQAQREGQIRVQELEVARRQQELQSTVIKQAEAESRKIELLAEAQRQRITHEAAGTAEATRVEGLAEAEVVRAKGQAEADAMHLRAEAYQEYTQAAVLDKLLSSLPELARAFSASLAGVDKVTIVSTGDGSQGGVSAYTGEVARMVAQAPALIETLTGLKLDELIGRLTAVEATEQPAVATRPNGTSSVAVKDRSAGSST